MQDNKNNVGGESMDELIARLREQAAAPAEDTAPTADNGDDELRRLLLGQLENKGNYERSAESEITESAFSLDEFEDEEDEPESVDAEPENEVEAEGESEIEDEIEDESELADEIEEIADLADISGAAAEIYDDINGLDVIDEDFDEDTDEAIYEDEEIEEDFDEKLDEIVDIEVENDVDEDINEDIQDEDVENEAFDEDEQVEDYVPLAAYEPANEEIAPDINDEDEMPDEAQIAIDISAAEVEEDESENAEAVLHTPPSITSDGIAASTDSAINGITPDEVLINVIANQVDEKTRARLLGIELPAAADAVAVDEDDAYEQADDTADSLDEGDEYDELLPEDQQEDDGLLFDCEDEEIDSEIPVSDPLQMGFDNESVSSASNQATDGDGNLPDTDVEMLLRLGYEHPLRQMIGDRKIEEIKQERLDYESVQESDKKPFGYRGREYSGRDMTADTQRAYERDRSFILARLLTTAVFALLLLLFAELPLIADADAGLWSKISGFVGSFAYPLTEMLLLLAAAAPSMLHLFYGIKGALRLEPNLYSVPAISVIIALANGAGYLFRRGGDIPAFFGGAALIILLMATVADLCAHNAEELAFSVVSSGKEKFLLADGTYSESETGADVQSCYNVRRARDISSYFARTAKHARVRSFLNYITPISIALSLILGGVWLIVGGGGLTSALRAATTTYFLITPGFFALGATLPLWLSNRMINRRGCAVIGSAAPDDYTANTRFGKEKKIFFADGDVLSAAYIKRISLRGDRDSEHYVRLANKLFYTLGGVLASESQGMDEPLSDGDIHIEIAESREHYLKLYMIDGDETVEVVMGSYDKLTRSGIKLPNENMERIYNDDKRDRLVVYLAFDGQFRLAYSIQYKLSSKFRRAAKRLVELGFVPSIETFDPMITPQMLAELRVSDTIGGELAICRADHFDSARPKRSCGVVATGNSFNLYYPLVSCERMRQAYRQSRLLSVILLAAGIGAMVTVIATGVLIFLRPWMTTLWQIIFGGIFTALAVYGINRLTLSMTSGATKVKRESSPFQKQEKPKKAKTKKAPSIKAKDAKENANEQ
ncbi:MAG: hypothetical protein IJX74_03030 [Clostridia bacterium]|nr:hypothetical protein [Clostridia bacterium]